MIERNIFFSKVVFLLRDSTFVDGEPHPLEGLLKETLDEKLIAASFDLLKGNPGHLATFLRCLGMMGENFETGIKLAERGLREKNIQVREAAVSALERCDDLRALELLKSAEKTEAIIWLRNYIRDILRQSVKK